MVPGKELGGATLSAWGVQRLYNCATAKQTLNAVFAFCLFFVKAKILFGFFLATENRYSCRPYIKSKWHKMSFQKAGDTCVNISNRGESLSSFRG